VDSLGNVHVKGNLVQLGFFDQKGCQNRQHQKAPVGYSNRNVGVGTVDPINN
jgi:hypothetical protein